MKCLKIALTFTLQRFKTFTVIFWPREKWAEWLMSKKKTYYFFVTNVCHLVGTVLLFYWKSFFSIRQSMCIYLYIFLYVISIAIWLSALQFFFWLSLTESENEFTRFHFLASFQVHLHCKWQIVQFFADEQIVCLRRNKLWTWASDCQTVFMFLSREMSQIRRKILPPFF